MENAVLYSVPRKYHALQRLCVSPRVVSLPSCKDQPIRAACDTASDPPARPLVRPHAGGQCESEEGVNKPLLPARGLVSKRLFHQQAIVLHFRVSNIELLHLLRVSKYWTLRHRKSQCSGIHCLLCAFMRMRTNGVDKARGRLGSVSLSFSVDTPATTLFPSLPSSPPHRSSAVIKGCKMCGSPNKDRQLCIFPGLSQCTAGAGKLWSVQWSSICGSLSILASLNSSF